MIVTNPSRYVGKGASYSEHLQSHEGSSLREAWRLVADLAESLGVESMDFSGGLAPRTKTLDELHDDLAEILPEGCTQDDAAVALKAMIGSDKGDSVWVVYHLREVGGRWQFVPFESFDSEESAVRSRDFWRDQMEGEVYVVVEHVVTVTKKVC